MSAALHHAMADAHRALALTLERWPALTGSLVVSRVQARSLGGETLLRAELQLSRAPELREIEHEAPERCPWAPELLEVLLPTGVIAMWPGRPLDLAQAIAAEGAARRALGRAARELRTEGEISDDAIDWLCDVARRLAPGELLDLVASTALEAARPEGLSPATRARLSAGFELEGRSAA